MSFLKKALKTAAIIAACLVFIYFLDIFIKKVFIGDAHVEYWNGERSFSVKIPILPSGDWEQIHDNADDTVLRLWHYDSATLIVFCRTGVPGSVATLEADAQQARENLVDFYEMDLRGTVKKFQVSDKVAKAFLGSPSVSFEFDFTTTDYELTSIFGDGYYGVTAKELFYRCFYLVFLMNGEYFEVQYIIPWTNAAPGMSEVSWQIIESFVPNIHAESGAGIAA